MTTEHRWLTSTDLSSLIEMAAGLASHRKMALFACAVASWRPPAGAREERALRAAELAADGLVAGREPQEDPCAEVYWQARQYVGEVMNAQPDRLPEMTVLQCALSAGLVDDQGMLLSVLRSLVTYAEITFLGGRRLDSGRQWFLDDLIARLRDVVGNPFRPAAMRPEWLAWQGGQVPRMARDLYDNRRLDLLPLLADAVADAGGPEDDEGLVAHLRGPGPHVLGCWALDAVLGME